MNSLRFSKRLPMLLLLSACPLLAQELRSGSTPAAKGPDYDIAMGYSHLTMDVSGRPTLNLSGAESTATVYVSPHWGATADASYVRAPRDPGSGHGSYVFSALAGPVFTPAQTDSTRFLIRALGGATLVDTAVPVSQLYYRGWLARFSWGLGTGIERNLSGPFAARFNVDYLRTRFMSTNAMVEPQNNLRVSANLVFRFASRRQKRYIAASQH